VAILATVFAASLAMTAALLLVTGCGGNEARLASDGPVRVLSASPSDLTYFSAEPIRIHFDRPVIASDAIGPVQGQLPVVVDPPTTFDGRFVDRQTLVLAPTSALAASTRYRVRLIGELGDKTGGYSFEFTSMPLEIEGVWGVDLNTLPATPSLPLHFNQPVATSAVEKHCKFSTPASFETIATKATVKDAGKDSANLDIPNVGSVVNIAPATPLDLNHDYRLMCSGLAGIGGAEPMSGLYALKLKTHPKLTVASVTPTGQGQVYADTTRFQIKFSTPMELDSLRKNIRLEPAVKGIELGWLDYRSTHYTANVELKVKTKYKLIIDGEVVDRFGQKLGKDHVVALETGNARPTISMETGIYAVEPTPAVTRCGLATSARCRWHAHMFRPTRSSPCSRRT